MLNNIGKASAEQTKLAQQWADNISKVSVPNKRHYLTQMKRGDAKDINTVIDNNKVDVAKDIQDIKNGLGSPIDDLKIKVNGRTYSRHGNGDNKLIPISSNNANEVFTLTRGEYKQLQEIFKNSGDVNKTYSYMSRDPKFNKDDFNRAKEVYNLTR